MSRRSPKTRALEPSNLHQELAARAQEDAHVEQAAEHDHHARSPAHAAARIASRTARGSSSRPESRSGLTQKPVQPTKNMATALEDARGRPGEAVLVARPGRCTCRSRCRTRWPPATRCRDRRPSRGRRRGSARPCPRTCARRGRRPSWPAGTGRRWRRRGPRSGSSGLARRGRRERGPLGELAEAIVALLEHPHHLELGAAAVEVVPGPVDLEVESPSR